MNCGCLDCANSEFLSTRPESKFRCLMLQRPDFCSEERHGNAKRASISPPVKGGKAPEKEGRAFLSASGISFQADQAWTAKDGSSTSPGESRLDRIGDQTDDVKVEHVVPLVAVYLGSRNAGRAVVAMCISDPRVLHRHATCMWRFRVETHDTRTERTTSEEGTVGFSADVSPSSGRNDRSHALNRSPYLPTKSHPFLRLHLTRVSSLPFGDAMYMCWTEGLHARASRLCVNGCRNAGNNYSYSTTAAPGEKTVRP